MELEVLQQLVGVAGVPVIIGLTQKLKKKIANSAYWPLLALGVGIVWNLGIGLALSMDWRKALAYGIVAGVFAAGLYDFRKLPGQIK